MTLPRLFVPKFSPGGGKIFLDGDEFHYLTRVVRVNRGAEFMIYGWGDEEARAVVEEIGRDYVVGRISEVAPIPPCPVSLTLLQAILKEDAMEEAIRGAAVLGVAALQAVLTARSVPRFDDPGARAKRAERWQKIAVRASSLARVARPMQVRDILDFADAVSQSAPDFEARWILSEQESNRSLASELAQGPLRPPASARGSTNAPSPRSGGGAGGGRHVFLLIGPEGGFTEGEVGVAESAGWTPVGVGRRILPASLAGVIAATLVLGYWGDLAPEKTAGINPRPTEEGRGERRRGPPSA